MILSVRAKIDAEQDIKQLADIGLAAVAAPVMHIMHQNVSTLPASNFQALIYTSRYAISAEHTALSQTAFCVGAGSARVAKEAGFSNVIAGNAGAEHLAQIIREQTKPEAGALYWPHGEIIQSDIGIALRKVGYQVQDIVTYRLVPAEDLPVSVSTEAACQQIQAVMCFSAQHLDQFARLLERAGLWHHHRRWTLIVPHRRVADSVCADWTSIHVSAAPSHAAMIAAAEAWAKAGL